MKKLVATAPRVAELKDYEDREIKSNEVKVKVEFAAPKHGTELHHLSTENLMRSGEYSLREERTSRGELSSVICPWEICLWGQLLRKAAM